MPGFSHDSTVADWGDIYDKLEAVYNKTVLKFYWFCFFDFEPWVSNQVIARQLTTDWQYENIEDQIINMLTLNSLVKYLSILLQVTFIVKIRITTLQWLIVTLK